MATRKDTLLLEERALDCEEAPKGKAKRGRPARSVTVNVAESPLGWLHSRGLVTLRQLDAGERLRADWERAQLAPRITMKWDAAPISSHRAGSSAAPDLSGSQIDAKRRFHAAIDHAGAGLGDILWRVVCSGEGMRASCSGALSFGPVTRSRQDCSRSRSVSRIASRWAASGFGAQSRAAR